jgi:hypothetical protein
VSSLNIVRKPSCRQQRYHLDAAQNPPVRYMLCRSANLTDVVIKTGAVSKLWRVKLVVVDLNREIFVNTSFIHSLVRENISGDNG